MTLPPLLLWLLLWMPSRRIAQTNNKWMRNNQRAGAKGKKKHYEQ